MLSSRALLFVRRAVAVHARTYAEAAPAAAQAMSFTFASPSQVFYNEANVKQVDVPTTTGMFGILSNHVPTLQVLRPGLVTVTAEDGSATKYFVSSGSVTVNADSSVQLLAEEAVSLDMLDPSIAKSNLWRKPRQRFWVWEMRQQRQKLRLISRHVKPLLKPWNKDRVCVLCRTVSICQLSNNKKRKKCFEFL
ncbi:ATP synthase subunit delta, mitochondrial [Hyperolius riggenbachi]|uniref:ATP synthase subunit delta, mitochondrial n=1 Tax=Hyperolius riggenbachi TaxID=752182 RepID=UPI0035A28C82